MYGCLRGMRTPAVAARCLSRRVAAWRPMRVPRFAAQDRSGGCGRRQRDRSPGPLRVAAGRARPCRPCHAHTQHAVTVLLAEVGDTGTARFEDPQPEQAQHGELPSAPPRTAGESDRGSVTLAAPSADADSRRSEWSYRHVAPLLPRKCRAHGGTVARPARRAACQCVSK